MKSVQMYALVMTALVATLIYVARNKLAVWREVGGHSWGFRAKTSVMNNFIVELITINDTAREIEDGNVWTRPVIPKFASLTHLGSWENSRSVASLLHRPQLFNKRARYIRLLGKFRIIADRTDVNQNMKSWRLPIIFHCNVRVDNQLRAEYQLSLYLHWLTNSNPRPIAPNECITSNRVCTLGGFGSALQA